MFFDAKEDILKEIPLKELANNSISTIIEKDDLLYIASSMSGLVIYDPRKNRVSVVPQRFEDAAYPLQLY